MKNLLFNLLTLWLLYNFISIYSVIVSKRHHINYFNSELSLLKKQNHIGLVSIQNHLNLIHPNHTLDFSRYFLPLNATYTDSLALAYVHWGHKADSTFIRAHHADITLIDQFYKECALQRLIHFGQMQFSEQGLILDEFKLIQTQKDSIYFGSSGGIDRYNTRTYIKLNDKVYHPNYNQIKINVHVKDALMVKAISLRAKPSELGLDTTESIATYYP